MNPVIIVNSRSWHFNLISDFTLGELFIQAYALVSWKRRVLFTAAFSGVQKEDRDPILQTYLGFSVGKSGWY